MFQYRSAIFYATYIMSSFDSDKEEFPGKLLHQASLWGNAELLEDLLNGEEIQFLDCQDGYGRTALHAAATNESVTCLRILLQAGADPNIATNSRSGLKTPLHIASHLGFIELIKLLLEWKTDIYAKDINGQTALDLADQAGHLHVIDLLKASAEELEKIKHELHIGLREACSRGDVTLAKQMIEKLADDAEMIINSTPNGSNTLLFKACEEGQKGIVKLLLDYGADGRVHPVTKYSPMYVAAYYGRRNIVELLLKKYPELVQVPTVEKWLPIHAATINGHIDVLELLLKYPNYPPNIMLEFTDKTQIWKYSMPFDVNSKDATGQTVLYLSCYVGNFKLADMLLKYRIKAERIIAENENSSKDAKDKRSDSETSPKKKISDSLASIMARLSMNRAVVDSNSNKNEIALSPLDLDIYCNNEKETALHAAVRKRHTTIVSALLQNNAGVNLVVRDDSNENTFSDDDSHPSAQASTALAEACKNRDLGVIDMLLKSGANDDNGQALAISVASSDDIIVSKLLTLKAFADPEFKINRKALPMISSNQFSGTNLFTYSSMFPTTAVMINWHNMKCLETVREKWLIDACIHHNSKLKLNIKNQSVSTIALTRLDLSNNLLSQVPSCLFQLRSLRTLNLAQNKIRHIHPEEVASKKSKTSSSRSLDLNEWNCPVLEEILLQDNRLDSVPGALFELPSLTTLDLSNNKLKSMPFKMWCAPMLQDLNLSLNMLNQLPLNCNQTTTNIHPGTPSESWVNIDQTGFDVPIDISSPSNQAKKEIESSGEDMPSNVEENELVHHNLWSHSISISDTISSHDLDTKDNQSCLTNLNLSHNSFKSIPSGLSCFATRLTRLNMSYNCLVDMSYVGSYPPSLKQLDLSYNQLGSWMSIRRGDPDLTGLIAETVYGNVTCYNPSEVLDQKLMSPMSAVPGRKWSQRTTSTSSSGIPNLSQVVGGCVHRRHTRLENLKTLILSNNQLSHFNLYASDEDFMSSDDYGSQDSLDISSGSSMDNQTRLKLVYPNVSMLDLSCNQITEIPSAVPQLTNLSVLNLSGNYGISALPPEMGLLSKLWNLNTRGCNLDEPLKSMIESKKYKTMDIIGYLKSILENAKLYARMKLMVVGIQGIGKTSLLDQLRQEGSGSYKKKPPEHWAKRMGNKNINLKTSKGVSMSTVGVDVGDWMYEKKVRGSSNYGPVMFRTWDFGGQREYYATHQYFLSKRSLYLVVWKITDGEKGVNEILHWLVNIQARAPNSPVIIIGTHYDLVKENFPAAFSEDLQQLIREKFMNVVDADKCGLPKVLDTIEVSCKTRHNIKLLCNLIYDTAFDLRSPGSKERLLEQKIPATYLALEDVIGNLSYERKLQGKDPVLRSEQYKMLVMLEVQEKYGISFRDIAELNQATTFLHENGVLLHYEDATLKDLYFLDPQWLCDMLAHVVTIREINPFAKNGIMKIDDLKHVFKTSNCAPSDAKSYILSLLNKFEVALTWDNRTLLVPSLLPTEAQLRLGLPGCDVRIPVRSRGWNLRNKQYGNLKNANLGTSVLSNIPEKIVKSKSGLSIEHIVQNSSQEGEQVSVPSGPTIRPKPNPKKSIHRLLLMSYYPSGFWSRLLTRMLADDLVVEVMRFYFDIPKEHSNYLTSLPSYRAEWVCWQTGVELRYFETTLFRVKEMLPESYLYLGPNTRCNTPYDSYDYRHMRFLLKMEGSWTDLNISNSAILEIFLPNHSISIQPPEADSDPIVLHPNAEASAKLLASAVDHIDTLLEDWYPTLGTRFVHTSEGKFLVTRLIPCSQCLVQQYRTPETHAKAWEYDSWQLIDQSGYVSNYVPMDCIPGGAVRQVASDELSFDRHQNRSRSQGSSASRDSGVCPDSRSSSRKPSMENNVGSSTSQSESIDVNSSVTIDTPVYSFMVEECILSAYENKPIHCPLHNELSMSELAPDAVFVDLGDRYIINSDLVKRGKMLGRGAFGFVFKATVRQKTGHNVSDIAMKMLQPVDPGFGARQSASAAYKAAWSKWQRDPLQYACKAYCTARQELNILLSLRHPHIVPLVGMCLKPLALVLKLAPLGALDAILKNFRRSGARLELPVIQKIILQIAKALEYLHQQHIIYRDLKSENVLVWALPAPFQGAGINTVVDVKLADYGISRATLPAGMKGFGGTEGFMAPEILKYNGEEEYTEKVDCFSFGMFMYELLTLHQPFEGYECVKDHVSEGGRPTLTQREMLYPTYILDLMTLCWAHQPQDRPTASQIVSIASAPEFNHLIDVSSLKGNMAVLDAGLVTKNKNEDCLIKTSDVWFTRLGKELDILSCSTHNWQDYKSLVLDSINITSMVVAGDMVWLGSSRGTIHIYGASTFEEVFSFSIDAELQNEATTGTAIRNLCYISYLNRIAIGSSSYRIWHCPININELPNFRDEIVELGNNGNPIYSMTCISDDSKRLCELWCGQSRGCISVYSFKMEASTKVVGTSQQVVYHYESEIDNAEVLQIAASNKDANHVWSYVYPGCVVYHWNVSTRTILNKVDCSKLVPCSESIMSISIEEHLSPGRCQVTAMAVVGASELYIGTTWGCIIVAEGSLMRPITVFRPFQEEVKAIISVAPSPEESESSQDHDKHPMLVTIGKGYRSLLNRYTTLPLSSAGHVVMDYMSMYTLLWRTENWLNL